MFDAKAVRNLIGTYWAARNWGRSDLVHKTLEQIEKRACHESRIVLCGYTWREVTPSDTWAGWFEAI